MGGQGSGGWNSSGRASVEATAKLAITALQKAGGLRGGASTVWRWSNHGETFASIGVHGGIDGVRLVYSVTEAGGQPRRVDQHITLEQRACRFGGQRPFFHCPRCARSVLNLHLSGGRFSCRNCARLTYASRREGVRDRNLRAANKLRERLGGGAGALNDIAVRPKGMWRASYDRIVSEIERREGFAHEELASWVMKLGARSQRPAAKGFWR